MADLPPIVLVTGNDRPRVRAELARIRAAFDETATETVTAESGNAQAVVDSCQMLGLFAERRLVVALGVEAWGKGDVDAVVSYASHPSPDAQLVLVAAKLDARSRMRKAAGEVIDCRGPDGEGEVVRWVVDRFADAGVTVSRQVAATLVSLAGHDSLDRLQTDVDRIVTYAGSDPVTGALVSELATTHTEEKVWALTDAWAARDKRRFLSITETLLDQGEHPVRLTAVLGRHLRQVHDARRLLDGGTPATAKTRLEQAGVHRFAAGKIVDQASRIGHAQALAALTRIAALEAELKGGAALSSGRAGSRPSATIVFERGLCELL